MLRLTITLILYILILSSCDKGQTESFVVEDIIGLHEESANISSDSTYWHLKKAEALIKRSSAEIPDSIKAENNFLIGNYFLSNSKKDSAAVYFHHATDYVNEPNPNNRERKYFLSAWETYSNLGLYGDCFTITKKYRSLLDPKTQFRSLSWAYFLEQQTYLMMGDHKKALESNDLRINIARLSDTVNLPPALVGQASLKYYYSNDKEGALKILENLLENENKLSYKSKRLVNTDYGVYSYYDGNYKKALFHYLKALKAAKKVGDTTEFNATNEIAICYNNIAEVYMDLSKYEMSKNYLDSVKLLGIKNLSRINQKTLLDYELRLALETNKSSKEISTVLNEIYAHQDEIYAQKSKSELLELTKSNEKKQALLKEKQEAQIENIKLQTRSIILIVSLILLTLIGMLFYGQRKLRFEKQSLQLQQRLFRSQMNPHFTYNTLYAIQKEIKTDPKSAESYLLKFSRLLRLVLENSMNNNVLLSKELDAVQKYLDLQLIHAPNKFQYEVILENLEEDELIFIPPMLIQPIIENSIEHGFSGIEYPGKLTLTLTLIDKFIRCSIDDNGKGLKEGVISEKQSASTKLIQDFLRKSNKKGFDIINKQDLDEKQSGLRVQFLIPYKYTEHD